MMQTFDVVIIGGSYAGLSAGMALGRALKRVLIIDSGQPCNRFTPYSHNFITHDGEKPADIAALAKEQVLRYSTVQWHTGKAIEGAKLEKGFCVVTEAGETFLADKLILATGVIDVMPEIPGFAECWGKTILHCPYCHGYEVKDEETGILLNGDIAVEFSRLILNWTGKLTLFTNGPATMDAAALDKLKTLGIKVFEEPITTIEHQEGTIHAVVLENGEHIALKALYNHPLRIQHSDLAETLGCQLTEHGLIEVDNLQKTTVPGIFAAGDNSTIFRAISAAVASGTMAGAMANKDLVMERF